MSRTLALGGAVLALGALGAGGALAQGGFDPVAATDAYLASVPAADKARSDAYFEGGYWLILWGLLADVAVAWVLLATGTAARLHQRALRLTRGRLWPAAFLQGIGVVLATTVLTLPLVVYEDFFREHQYGLSNQGFGEWLLDQLKVLPVSLLATGFTVAMIYLFIRRVGWSWWAWGGGFVVLFQIFAIMVAPVFIAPLLNDYKPLRQGELREAVLSMARANGVPADDVYEFDASRQSDRISANVSGFLGTTRISLNDNLLNKTTPQETLAVMGHEVGHYVLNHSVSLLLQFGLVIMAGFLFVDRLFPRLLARFGQGWGVRGIDDPAGLPLLTALVSVYFFLATPVTNSIIRSVEAEADMFGLNAAREPDAFATVALKLGQYRKLDPAPWEEVIFFDHPSGRSRILMSMRWKAEQPGVGEPALQVGEAAHGR